MGDLEAKYRGILRRAGDLAPLAARVRDALRRGKAEQLLAGEDASGVAYPRLARSTLARDPGRDPTPLVPRGPASGLVEGYSVEAEPEGGRLRISAGWPGRPYVRFLRSGTRRMPRRDPGGFREADRARVLSMLGEHVRGPDR